MVSNCHRLIFTYLSPLSVATCFERSSVYFQEPSGASPRSYEGDESSQGSGGTKEGHEEGDEGHEGKVSRIGLCVRTDVPAPVEACTVAGECISTPPLAQEPAIVELCFKVRTLVHLLRRCTSWYIFSNRTDIATTHESKQSYTFLCAWEDLGLISRRCGGSTNILPGTPTVLGMCAAPLL